MISTRKDRTPMHVYLDNVKSPVKWLRQASCSCMRGRSEETEMHHKQSATDRATKSDHHLGVLRILLQSGPINKGGLEEKKLLSDSKSHKYSPESPHLSFGQRESNLPFSCLGPVIQSDTLICGNHRGLLRPASCIYDRLRLPQMHISLVTAPPLLSD